MSQQGDPGGNAGPHGLIRLGQVMLGKVREIRNFLRFLNAHSSLIFHHLLQNPRFSTGPQACLKGQGSWWGNREGGLNTQTLSQRIVICITVMYINTVIQKLFALQLYIQTLYRLYTILLGSWVQPLYQHPCTPCRGRCQITTSEGRSQPLANI